FALDFAELKFNERGSCIFPIKHLEEATNTPKEFRGKNPHLKGSAVKIDGVVYADWQLGRSIIMRAAQHKWIPEMPKMLLMSVYFRGDSWNKECTYVYALPDNLTFAAIGLNRVNIKEGLVKLGKLGKYPMHYMGSDICNPKQIHRLTKLNADSYEDFSKELGTVIFSGEGIQYSDVRTITKK
ncbi:MAG: hypothetical protein WDA28_13080, partial [Castellaniella sp.]